MILLLTWMSKLTVAIKRHEFKGVNSFSISQYLATFGLCLNFVETCAKLKTCELKCRRMGTPFVRCCIYISVIDYYQYKNRTKCQICLKYLINELPMSYHSQTLQLNFNVLLISSKIMIFQNILGS